MSKARSLIPFCVYLLFLLVHILCSQVLLIFLFLCFLFLLLFLLLLFFFFFFLLLPSA